MTMNTRSSFKILATVAALATLGATPALAGQVGKAQVDLSPVYLVLWGFQANSTVDVEVYNATIDPVLHVQDTNDPNGGFLAGNDDCTSADFTRSCVRLDPVSVSRNVAIVVRSYAGLGVQGPIGQGRLAIRINGTLFSDSAITFAGERRSYTFPLPTGATFAGAAIQKLSSNLVMLAVHFPSDAK